MFKSGTKWLSMITAVALSACAAAEAPPAHETAADSAAVRELATKYQTAWNAGDAAAIGSLVTDNYFATESSGLAITGRAGVEAQEKTEIEARKGMAMTLELTPGTTAFMSATTASSTGTWTLKGAPAGSGPDKGSYLVVSVKGADGQWRMQNALAAAYVPPPAAPAAVKK